MNGTPFFHTFFPFFIQFSNLGIKYIFFPLLSSLENISQISVLRKTHQFSTAPHLTFFGSEQQILPSACFLSGTLLSSFSPPFFIIITLTPMNE
jgi:hypothetical protein